LGYKLFDINIDDLKYIIISTRFILFDFKVYIIHVRLKFHMKYNFIEDQVSKLKKTHTHIKTIMLSKQKFECALANNIGV
jgi:hypothetical protein